MYVQSITLLNTQENQSLDMLSSEAEKILFICFVIDESRTEQTPGHVFLNMPQKTKAKPRFLLISGNKFCFQFWVSGKHSNVGLLVYLVFIQLDRHTGLNR